MCQRNMNEPDFLEQKENSKIEQLEVKLGRKIKTRL